MIIAWLVAVPLVMAAVVLAFRRLPLVATPLAMAAMLAMAILCETPETPQSIVFLGRALTVSKQESLALAFCSLILFWVTLYGYRLQRDAFQYALALLGMAFFTASTVMRNAVIASLLLQLGIVSTTMLIPSGRPSSAMTASRSLVMLALSGPLMLVAAWTAESQGAAASPLVARLGSIALALGFGIALGVIPFHIWLPPLLTDSSPIAVLMFGVVLSTVVLLRLVNMLQLAAWPGGSGFAENLLLYSGLATVCVAGLAAPAQRSGGRILAFAAIADLGFVMLGVGTGTPASLGAAIWHLVARGIGFATTAMALGILRHVAGGDDSERLTGAIRRAPLAVTGLIVGGLSLSGLPLTAGYAGRYALLQAVDASHSTWILPLLASGLGPAWAFARCAIATLSPSPAPGGAREPLVPALLVLMGALGLLLLGLYPAALVHVLAD